MMNKIIAFKRLAASGVMRQRIMANTIMLSRSAAIHTLNSKSISSKRSFATIDGYAAESEMSTLLDSNTLFSKLYADSSSAQQSMQISGLIDAMVSFQDQELDADSFSELAPMADELVHYLAETLQGETFVTDAVKPSQMVDLLKFGNRFQIGDQTFWKFTLTALSENLTSMTSDDLLTSLTLLEQGGRLRHELMVSCLQQILSHANKLSVSELQVLLLILNSDKASHLDFVNTSLPKLEQRLQALSSKIGAEDIGKFAYSVPVSQDSSNFSEFTCNFGAEFFSSKAAALQEWMEAGKVPFEDWAWILKVYKCKNVQKPEMLLRQIEDYILDNHQSIKIDTACELIVNCGESLQEVELVEVLEKIIAHGVDKLIQVKGAAEVIPVLRGFISSEYSRSKIIQFLTDFILKEFDDLETSEQAEFLRLINNVRDEQLESYEQEIQNPTYFDGILETCQPYISAKLPVLTAQELIDFYFGFNHPNTFKRASIIDQLEARLISLQSISSLTPSEQIQLIFECSKSQSGSKPLITSLHSSLNKFLSKQYSDFRNNNYHMVSDSEMARLSNHELH